MTNTRNKKEIKTDVDNPFLRLKNKFRKVFSTVMLVGFLIASLNY